MWQCHCHNSTFFLSSLLLFRQFHCHSSNSLSLSVSVCVCVCVQLVGVSVWLVGRKSWAIISAILLLNYFCSPSLPSHHFSLLSLTFFSQFRQYQCRNSHLSSFSLITLNRAYITNKLHFIQCSTKRLPKCYYNVARTQ